MKYVDYTMGEFEYNKFFTMCNWHDGGVSKAEFYLLGDVLDSSKTTHNASYNKKEVGHYENSV